MASFKEPARADADSRERNDLQQKYRPIGIGAVAAAVSPAGKDDTGTRQDGDIRERNASREWIAA